MHLLGHHIYEYHKGLRELVMYTTKAEDLPLVEKRLKQENIEYIIANNNKKNINVFFGDTLCLNVLMSFGKKKLKELTA